MSSLRARAVARVVAPGQLARRIAATLSVGAFLACGDRDQPVGVIEGAGRSAASVARSTVAQRAAGLAVESLRETASDGQAAKQILFGDLHVHSTYSIDAFLYALPIFGGEGAHPPADACDFARYCSSLDFFSLNDHAEGLTPERWQRTKESLRECNARAGDPANPDLVAFVGWEWTQSGQTPETHFGHKNVIFPGLADDELPTRPINALPDDVMKRARFLWLARGLQALGAFGLDPYADFLWWIERLAGIPSCPRGVDVRELPADCRESAATPEVLFEKLTQWGFDTLVIPHGMAWGIHAPPGARFGVQLGGGRHLPEQQRLLEVYSGHGNSEEFRSVDEFVRDDETGERICPRPTADYLPCCWRAGELIRERCGDLPEAECQARVEQARKLAIEANRRPHWVIPDASEADWLDCDQCRDCFKPALTLRPGMSAQYALALSNFDAAPAEAGPGRFRFGLIASSDIHNARAGTGYKQVARKSMTDARGLRSERVERVLGPFIQGRQKDPQRAQPEPPAPLGFRALFDVERGASFMYPGGLVAVHAAGRDRASLWRALVRREVYGTSGPRILLWFDLLNGRDAATASHPLPMGGELTFSETPRFEVRAVGAFVQQPGCPEDSLRALSTERLERLCRGECYHPTDERHRITAIEVVRIRPQRHPDEPIERLIEDPWRRFECEGEAQGCVVRFEDPDYPRDQRDSVYYVRALQEETPAINAANLRTRFDAEGQPVAVDPCYGGYRTDPTDDCLAPAQERAWSSPIFLDWPRAARPSPEPLQGRAETTLDSTARS